MHKKLSFKIAYSGVMAALGVAIMLLSSFIPVLTYISPLIASVLLVPTIEELGNRWAWTQWVCVCILSLLLCADKEAAFMLLFTGYYPMIKPKIDKISSKVLRVIIKLGAFLIAIVAMYLIVCLFIPLGQMAKDFKEVSLALNAIFILVLTLVMMMFDMILGNFTKIYNKRIKPRIKKSLKMTTFVFFVGFIMIATPKDVYAKTKAVTYFGDQWAVNFLNCEHAQAEEDFARIKADGFNTVIYCVPWREVQPSGDGFDEKAIAKLDEMITRAGNCGLNVMLRVGYTWDYADINSVLTKYQGVFDGSQKDNWLKYATKIYQVASAHGNYAGAFITWEDFWPALKATCSSYKQMDEKLIGLLVDTQAVFPNLSMECRLHSDTSGDKVYDHTSTFGCGNASYSAAMLAVSMGYEDGTVIDTGAAVAKGSQMISLMQSAGKPVFIDQFLYMETTPGYDNSARVANVNSYLAAMGGVFNNQTIGYGIWTYKDYGDSIIYNPEFGLNDKGWTMTDANVVKVNGNNKVLMSKGGEITQSLVGRGFNSKGTTKAKITVDAETPGNIRIMVGGVTQTEGFKAGHHILTFDLGTQVKNKITITSSCKAYVDNIKLYSFETKGDVYTIDGAPGPNLSGIRALNAGIK